jgi:hypothetical protein
MVTKKTKNLKEKFVAFFDVSDFSKFN